MEDRWEEVWFHSKEERDSYIKEHNVCEDYIYLEHNKSACERRDMDYNLVEHEVGLVYNLTKNHRANKERDITFKLYDSWNEALNG